VSQPLRVSRPLRVSVAGEPPRELLPDRAGGAPGPGESVTPLPRSLRAPRGGQRFEVVVDGWRFEVLVEPAEQAELRERARRAATEHQAHVRHEVRAQIPGRVVSVLVAVGDTVQAGQPLLSVEAMKMENEVRAPRPGTIGRVAVSAGERVELGDELVVIE
jgi:biotin carboxyl carrier protein